MGCKKQLIVQFEFGFWMRKGWAAAYFKLVEVYQH